MAEFRNRVITDFWTLVLPSGWSELGREGKPGVAFASDDSTKTVIVVTSVPVEDIPQSAAAILSEFEASVRGANEKILGGSYVVGFSERSVKGSYLASTVAGFDASSRMGICARKYAKGDLSILVQVHDYDSADAESFDAFWRSILADFVPLDEKG